MPNVYVSKNRFYLKENEYYRQQDLLVRSNTIVLQPTSIVVAELEDAKVYTYIELKDLILRG